MKPMDFNILTNIQIRQIEDEIDKISAITSKLDPDLLDDCLKIARYEEILEHYAKLLRKSFKEARIFESNLRLVI